MIKVNRKLLLISALVLSTAGLTSCAGGLFAGKMPAGGFAVPVAALTLNSNSVAQSEIYQAKLISRHSVWLQPQVAGQIADIYVTAGDHVSAGQPLILIDNRKQEATLNSSRATASVAKATLNNYQIQRKSLQSNLALNKQLYERYRELYAKKSVSKQDFEKYTDSYTKALADLDANTAQIQAQKAEIQKALSSINEQAVQLQYYKISAPYSGVVGDIPVKIGNYVLMTNQLLNITQNDPLEINVGLPVEKVFNIHKGMAIEILDNDGKVVGNSKISFVSPNIDTSTQTILVKAILRNKEDIFKADQSVKARVIYNQKPGILVPTNAISHFGGQDFAFILIKKDKETLVKQVPVKLGDIQDNKYIVLSGLKKGDQIVSQGIQKLMDGAPVTILPERK